MPGNLEKSAEATGLKNVSFHSSPKERQCQRMLNGHGFGWTQGVGDGQGGLAFCGSWGRKEAEE